MYNSYRFDTQAAKRNAVRVRSSPRCRKEAAFLSQTKVGSLRVIPWEGWQSANDSKPEDLPLESAEKTILSEEQK